MVSLAVAFFINLFGIIIVIIILRRSRRRRRKKERKKKKPIRFKDFTKEMERMWKVKAK